MPAIGTLDPTIPAAGGRVSAGATRRNYLAQHGGAANQQETSRGRIMFSSYDIDKALYRLNSPKLNQLPPDSRWRKTDFFGVPPEALHVLEAQGVVERRQVTETSPVQWRKVG
jgi:hypothetical protein